MRINRSEVKFRSKRKRSISLKWKVNYSYHCGHSVRSYCGWKMDESRKVTSWLVVKAL